MAFSQHSTDRGALFDVRLPWRPLQQIGLPLRAGLHTGEIEIRGRDIGGIAVHAAARVMAQSNADEVLVPRPRSHGAQFGHLGFAGASLLWRRQLLTELL
jgi:class 3 adenylate cyclase